MFCTKCGKELDDQALYCNNCGCKVSEEAEDIKIEHVSKKSKILWITLGIILLVTIIEICTIFALGGDKRKVEKQLSLGEQYLEELKYEQAIAVYEEAIKIDPKCEDAYEKLAEIYVALERYDDAVAILEAGIEETGSESLKSQLEEINAIIAAQAQETVEEEVVEQEVVEETTEETVIQTGFVYLNGRIYYYDETGTLVYGWFSVDENKYYATDDGSLYIDGTYTIENKDYKFDEQGVNIPMGEWRLYKKTYTGDYFDRSYYDRQYEIYDEYENVIQDLYGDNYEYKYDDEGKIIEKKCISKGGGSTNITYTYLNGKLISEKYNNGFEVFYQYDDRGNMISKTNSEFIPDENWEEACLINCNYDSSNNKIYEKIIGNGYGVETTYTYDETGKLIKTVEENVYDDQEGTDTIITTYKYNEKGLLVSTYSSEELLVTTYSGEYISSNTYTYTCTVSYEYNENDLLIKETRVNDTEKGTITYEYVEKLRN